MDPYKILGVEHNASMDEIKRAYRKRARENHPDLNPGDAAAAERMNKINEAYDRIINPDKYAAKDARRSAASGQRQYNPYGNPTGGSQYSSGGYGQSQQGSGQYGWYGDFDFEDIFGGFYTTSAPIHPEPNVNDSPEIRQAINFVNSKNFNAANKILYTVKSTDRNARWYYIIALSNHGQGNTILAIDQIKKACELEPNNIEYKQAARAIHASGRTYTTTGQSKGFSSGFLDPSTICCICIMINMCFGGGGTLCCRFH